MTFTMRTRSVPSLLVATVLGLSLAACGASTPKKPVARGTLRLALIGAPGSISPLQVANTSGTEVDNLIYDGLVRVSPSLLPQPDLASRWRVSKDGRVYTFHLNPKALWQDGQPVTPQDVVFSLSAYRNPLNGSASAPQLAIVQSVAAAGKDEVQIRLSHAFSPFLLDIATLPILPSHLLANLAPGTALLSAPALGAQAVGSGPFQLISAANGTYTLLRNPHYFLGPVRLDKVILQVEPSAGAALSLLRQGQLDLAPVPPVDATAVATWPHVRQEKTFQLAFAGIVWNTSRPPFNSPILRRALYFAINRAQIVSGPLYGYAAIANGPLPPVSWAYDKALSARAYAPQKALQLLAGAGYQPSGGILRSATGAPLRLEILAPSGAPDRTAVLGLVARDLAALGVDLTVRYEPFDTYIKDYVSGDFQAAFTVRGLFADPDLSAYFGSAAVSAAGENPGLYANVRVDQYLTSELSTTNQAARAKDLQGVQEQMQVDPPELFLYFPQSVDAISTRFAGFQENPAVPFYAPASWYLAGGG